MLIAAVRSAVAYLSLGLYVLIAGPVGMLLALLFRWKSLLYVLGHAGVRVGLSLTGIRYRMAGTEHLPRGSAAVYCANHESNVDPPILFEALHPRMHMLYKSEFDAIPILARAIRLGGFIPVDRHNKEAAMHSIDAGAESLRSGNSFLIFPEGTREPAGELLPFKKGGFIMAIKAGAPIVPVSIQGGRAAMRKGSWILWPTLVTVKVGEPISTAGLDLRARDALIAQTRERIMALREDRATQGH